MTTGAGSSFAGLQVALGVTAHVAAAGCLPASSTLAVVVPALLLALAVTSRALRVTNARTEGHNRVIKQVKRVACGFRNQANYERRIMLHSAARRVA